MPDSINQIGYEAVTVSSTAIGLTGVSGKKATRTLLTLEGAASTDFVRWRGDGTNPTATVGHPLADGNSLQWTDPFSSYTHLIENVKFILDSGASGDATLHVSYFD